jgi:type IV pilus biogenesis protein CpaD/CtpE
MSMAPQMRDILQKTAAATGVALLLAGCEAQPIGPFDEPRFIADGAQAQHDLYFQPGSPQLLRGEAERLQAFLQSLVLGPEEDVVVHPGKTGSPVLDAQRLSTLRSAFARTPARVRVVLEPGFSSRDARADAVLVQVIRYDRIRVECPGNTAGPHELTTPLPPIGCANAINRATMAAEKRDLVVPRELKGSEAGVSADAVIRHRQEKVITLPIDVSGG